MPVYTDMLLDSNEPTTGPSIKGAAKRVVYVIDDDVEILKSLRFVLLTWNICPKTFTAARHFLAELPSLTPAPIMVDLRMPGMSGLDLLSAIRSLKIDWLV